MESGSLTILAIDDQAFDAEALRRQLARLPGLEIEFHACLDPDDGLARLESEPIDLVFLDYRLDGAVTGLDLVRTIRAHGDIRPVVVLTGQGDEYVAAEITRCGADDYIVKSDLSPDLLRRAIDNAMAQHRGREAERELARRHEEIRKLSDELTEANVRLAELTRTDCLTQLMNRRAWEAAIEIEHERCKRHGMLYGVIVLDVDHFKQFNDTQGHQAGDACLRRVADVMRCAVRTTDFVGRYGGEEFVVLCPETGAGEAQHLAERIRAALLELAIPHPASPTGDVVTACLGVAEGPCVTWEESVRLADEALYAAKRSGRNRACMHDGDATNPASAA